MPRPRIGSDQLTIAQLEAILQKRRGKVGALQRRRNALQKRLDALDAKIAALGGNSRMTAGGRAHNAESLPQTIINVLTRHGGPMKVADIVKAVLATGYRSSSDKFRGIVNQTLIKDKRFTAAQRGVYQLKKGA